MSIYDIGFLFCRFVDFFLRYVSISVCLFVVVLLNTLSIHSSRQESVVCNFTISYYPWSSKSVASLLDKVESTSTLNNLALENVQVMPVLGKLYHCKIVNLMFTFKRTK